MKRFSFQLDSLLRLRSQAERMAELRRAEAKARLDAAQARLADLERDMIAACQTESDRVGRAVAAGDYLARQFLFETRQRQIAVAREQVGLALRAWQQAGQEHRELAVQVKALESLRELRSDEHREQALKEIQTQLDETVMRQWSETGRDARRDTR